MAKKKSSDEIPVTDIPQLGLSDALAVMDEEKTELDKVLELLLDPKNIGHNTELSMNEITAFSVLGSMQRRHKLPVLTDFLAENLEKRVSKKRQGRKEWIKIVGRHLENDNQNQMQQQTGWRRFLRR